MRHRAKAIVVGALFVAQAAGGCGTTAIIELADGDTLDCEIISGDRRQIFINAGEDDRTAIDRGDIVDIDHPGNVAATIGAVLVGYGGMNIAVGASRCNSQEPAYCFGVFTPTVAGFALISYGLSVYRTSVWASKEPARKRKGRRASLRLAPTPLMGQYSVAPGLSLDGTF